MTTRPKPTRGQVAEGLGALAVLVAGLIGIPTVLAVTVGWPLPRRVPTGAQIGQALRTSVPDSFWPHLFATLGWLAWAYFTVSVVTNLISQLQGRRRHRRPRRGAQSAVAALIAAVVVLGQFRVTTTARPVAPVPSVGIAFEAASTTTATLASTATPVVHAVVDGDTLWGIAATYYGAGERWPAIYEANAGVPQPGGGALSDPHWIYPGWSLVIPVGSVSAPVTAPPTRAPIFANGTPPGPVPITPVPTTPVPATKVSSSPTSSAAHKRSVPKTRHLPPSSGSGAAPHQHDASETPVRLPSGSVVAGSFATAVLAAFALGRLRRRHAYRYRPPRPGRDLPPEPLGPALRHLAQAAADHRDDDEANETAPLPILPYDDPERRQYPGRIDIGTRNGETVTIEVTDLSGIAITGPACDDIARALITALLARAGPGAAEVLLTADLAERLLPGLDPDDTIRRAQRTDDVARTIEAEMIARTRRLAAADAPDATSYRMAVPENPLPLLLAILVDVPDDSMGRWSALLAGAPCLDIAVLFLAANRAATGQLVADASRTVTKVTVHPLAEQLTEVQLFGLRADEAVEVLGAIVAAHVTVEPDADAVESAQAMTEPHRNRDVQQVHSRARARPATAAEPWTEGSPLGSVGERPISVQVLGPYRITAHGEEVRTGLRSRARMLLAWYLLRPDGATSDEAVEALWPDTSPERVQRQFWYALGDLRTRLRGFAEETLEVLIKAGEQYQPTDEEVSCDLWDFQRALADAARAHNDEDAREALRLAVDVYKGDLLEGSDYPWVETVRHDLHRRALDAHLRLAEHEENAGYNDAAVQVLEHAIDLDRYAEEPYRRLMTLHATRYRLDAVTATWCLLHQRLGDLDLDVEAITARLYRSLTASDAGMVNGPRPIQGLP